MLMFADNTVIIVASSVTASALFIGLIFLFQFIRYVTIFIWILHIAIQCLYNNFSNELRKERLCTTLPLKGGSKSNLSFCNALRGFSDSSFVCVKPVNACLCLCYLNLINTIFSLKHPE